MVNAWCGQGFVAVIYFHIYYEYYQKSERFQLYELHFSDFAFFYSEGKDSNTTCVSRNTHISRHKHRVRLDVFVQTIATYTS